MKERRRYSRFKVEGSDIDISMIPANDIRVSDISIGGISLKAQRRVEIGRKYSLRLEHRDRALSLNGIVVWSILTQLDEKPCGVPIYRAGMQFDNALTDNEIMDLICTCKLEKVHKVSGDRLNAGFRLGPAQKTILSFPVSCLLKTINLRHMVIESEHELEVQTILLMETSCPGNKSLSLRGRVVYCAKTATCYGAAGYYAGIEFIDMPEKNKNELKKLIRRIEEKHDDFPLFVNVYPDKIL